MLKNNEVISHSKKRELARYVLEILHQTFVKRSRQDFLAHRAVKIVRVILAVVIAGT